MDTLHSVWDRVIQQMDTTYFVGQAMVRLILAVILGGAIGLERELNNRPAGLRTNMFICFGSCLFTLLSFKLADQFPGDHTRIAAQIIPGIGFIGAGSILHERGSVTGLTTAATMFVVASIGMACGGGVYITAIFATVILLLALTLLAKMENKFNLKDLTMIYEVRGGQADALISAINGVLELDHKIMQSVQVSPSDGHFRVQFTVVGKQREHDRLLTRLKEIPQADSAARLTETAHE